MCAIAGAHLSPAFPGPQPQARSLSFLCTLLALAGLVFIIPGAYPIDLCVSDMDFKLLKSRNWTYLSLIPTPSTAPGLDRC